MSTAPFGLTKPCKLCPFRRDVRPYLTRARVRGIARSLERSTFACHETTGVKDGEVRPREEHVHCAGALIVLERMNRPSQSMRIGERLGLYDRTRLAMDAPVFDSLDEMVEAQIREAP